MFLVPRLAARVRGTTRQWVQWPINPLSVRWMSELISKTAFATHTKRFLDAVERSLEEKEDRLKDLSYADGVLSVSSQQGTWVLNTHSVTRQIWVSSPQSGPSKYYYDAKSDDWLNERDNRSLTDLVQAEFSKVLGSKFTIEMEPEESTEPPLTQPPSSGFPA